MGMSKQVHVGGPLAPHVVGFGDHLAEQGYTLWSVNHQMRLMAHVSRWLVDNQLGAADLTGDVVEQFLAARRKAGYVNHRSARGMSQLLGYLGVVGLAPLPTGGDPVTAVDVLVERYAGYLVRERGLAPQSIDQYVRVARAFLLFRSPDGECDLDGVTAVEVSEFVLLACRGGSPVYAKRIASRLRSLLGFLFVEGLTETALAAAVPSVSTRRLATVTKAVSADDVARLLGSCDRRTAVGRRDFAIITVLARLGLRAGEVAGLRLADIDWRHGEVVVRGKGRHVAKLPLPVDVGEAIVGWLQRGRTRGDCPYVFTRVRAPLGPLSTAGLSMVVASACRRAGLVPFHAHRLRHTAATEVLRAGGSLAEVAQLLRHQSQDTTSIYAKVDQLALSAVVQPWPASAT